MRPRVSSSSANMPLLGKPFLSLVSRNNLVDSASLEGREKIFAEWKREYVNGSNVLQIGGKDVELKKFAGNSDAGRQAYEFFVNELLASFENRDCSDAQARVMCEFMADQLVQNGIANMHSSMDMEGGGIKFVPRSMAINLVRLTDRDGFAIHTTAMCRDVKKNIYGVNELSGERDVIDSEQFTGECGANALEIDTTLVCVAESMNPVLNAVSRKLTGGGKHEQKLVIYPVSIDITTPFKEVRDHFVTGADGIWDRVYAFFAALFDLPCFTLYNPNEYEQSVAAQSRPSFSKEPVTPQENRDLQSRRPDLFGNARTTRLSPSHKTEKYSESRNIVIPGVADIVVNPNALEKKETDMGSVTRALGNVAAVEKQENDLSVRNLPILLKEKYEGGWKKFKGEGVEPKVSNKMTDYLFSYVKAGDELKDLSTRLKRVQKEVRDGNSLVEFDPDNGNQSARLSDEDNKVQVDEASSSTHQQEIDELVRGMTNDQKAHLYTIVSELLGTLRAREVSAAQNEAVSAARDGAATAIKWLTKGNFERATRQLWISGEATKQDLRDVAEYVGKVQGTGKSMPGGTASPVVLYMAVLDTVQPHLLKLIQTEKNGEFNDALIAELATTINERMKPSRQAVLDLLSECDRHAANGESEAEGNAGDPPRGSASAANASGTLKAVNHGVGQIVRKIHDLLNPGAGGGSGDAVAGSPRHASTKALGELFY